MTLQNLYIKVRKNKITKQRFLAEARRHAIGSRLVTSLNSFDDTVRILKNNGLISEFAGVGKQRNENKFNLNRYLREIEDEETEETAPEEEEAPEEETEDAPEDAPAEEEAPEEEAPEEEEETGPSPELSNLTSKYLNNLRKIPGYDEMDSAVMYLEQIIETLPYGKSDKISLLNTIRSKYMS